MTKYGRITTAEGAKLYFPEKELKLAAGLLKAGKPVAFIGEPGCGKTDLARALLTQAKTDRFYQQEFGGIVSGDMLDGEKSIGDDNKLIVIPSEHLKAVRDAAQSVKKVP